MVSEHSRDTSRLAYLGHLGVAVYVSRRPLLQALDSRIVVAPARPVLAAARPPAALQSAVPDAAVRSVVSGARRTVSPPLANQVSDVPPASASTSPVLPTAKAPAASRAVAFSLLTVTFHTGVMFVSDIRQAPLSSVLESSVMAFLHDVMFALGRPASAEKVMAEYFQWPLVKKLGVDASASTAKDVLAGLINRQLRESQADCIVLMGSQARTYIQLNGDVVGDGGQSGRVLQVQRREPLGKYFAEPALKAGLWHSLQPLIVKH